MARTFGKLLCTIWADDDWLTLTPNAKVLYSAFLSQPDISAAGILPWTDRRWRRWIDGTPEAVETALTELVAARFVYADEDTSEVWVRSFIRHDGRLENSKLAASVKAAVAVIRSKMVLEAVHSEYPGVFPGGRPFDGPSDRPGRPIEPASDVTDLEPDLEQNLPPLPNPADITPDAIAQAGGRIFAKREATGGRARDEAKLAAWKADEIANSGAASRLAEWNRNHHAWSGQHIPLTVLAASAMGDTHSLAQYPEHAPEQPAVLSVLSREQRQALVNAARSESSGAGLAPCPERTTQ